LVEPILSCLGGGPAATVACRPSAGSGPAEGWRRAPMSNASTAKIPDTYMRTAGPRDVGASPASDRADKDVTLAMLVDRVKQLETAPLSRREQFDSWAGLIALVLSISTGGFTLYDRIVLQPQVEQSQKLNEFHDAIARINEINKDLSAQTVMLGVANAEKELLLEKVESTLPTIRPLVGAPEFAVLAVETMNKGDAATAKLYIESAMGSPHDEAVHVDILRHRGQIYFMTGRAADTATAESSFVEAFQTLRKHKHWGASAERALLLRDWAVAEAYYGDCAHMRDRLQEFVEEIARDDVSVEARKTIRGDLKRELSGQERCSWSVPSSLEGGFAEP